MQKISIDFVAGSHGNFLEFVCNKFIAKLDINFSPFNSIGASHVKSQDYKINQTFIAEHFILNKIPLHEKVVRITFSDQDLLQLSSICFLRAGNQNLDNDQLENNTYNKLNDKFYKDVLIKINHAYPSIMLSSENPNCPRYILREFFKFGFRDCDNHGLIMLLKTMIYPLDHKVFDFAFETFYNTEMFVDSVRKLAHWLNVDQIDIKQLVVLHEEFLQRQIFRNCKQEVDNIIIAVQNKQEMSIPKLNLLQESYINGVLERMYQIEMPFKQPIYFSNTKQIIQHLGL